MTDNNCDDLVDDIIKNCLNLNKLKSFFIQAGAGSGKTSSLVKALNYINEQYGEYLYKSYKKVAVITYTNAARDEIVSRVSGSSNFKINTIHSFLWDLIKNHQNDIREWMISNTRNELSVIMEKEANGRRGTKASKDRIKKIHDDEVKLQEFPKMKKFIYNPNGENYEKEALNHSDVIKIGSSLINDNEVLQKILINTYPIILVDESQDTKKELVDALLSIESIYNNKVCIGMFGDTMQRIYLDGKDDLVSCIPNTWEKPVKKMNHRSARRIITLANSIRKGIDDIQQEPRTDAKEGLVRFFLVDNSSPIDENKIELEIAKEMSKYTSDNDWLIEKNYQKLVLEHYLIAKRMGFEDFFAPLYKNDKFKQGLLDGSLAEYKFFIVVIIPLIKSINEQNDYEIMKILRANSFVFTENFHNYDGKKQYEMLQNTNKKIIELSQKIKKESQLSGISILKLVEEEELFNLPTNLKSLITYESISEIEDDNLKSLFSAFSCPLSSIIKYEEYINGHSSFTTHQGVKGLEYPNVMVIMSDQESNGFLFNYDKLFGVVEKSDRDILNEQEGKDSSIKRTLRLFYVACTRAKDSLALVLYTNDVEKAKLQIISQKWASKGEIIFK
ncbi:MAG: UvrD-helicase domain-containing protein [Sphaerochaeta sp.]